MSKAKILWSAIVITLLLVIVGRFVLARTLLSWSADLQANVIDTNPINDGLPDIEDFQEPNTTLSWNNTLEQEPEDDAYSWSIDIAIPYWLDKSAIQWLTDQINLDEKNNITLRISQAKDKMEYKDRLATRIGDFDIILAPSTVYDNIQDDILSLPFQENIVSVFHPSVTDIITESNMSFLPFGLDPIITYSQDVIADEDFTREDIDRYILTHPIDNKIGLWFGISPVDIKLLEAWRAPLAGYTQTLEVLISSILEDSNAALLASLIQPSTWDFRSLYKAANSDQSKSDLDCQNDLALCLFARDELQIWFGQLTDVLHTDQQATISPLPHSIDLTHIARWWVVPSETNSRSAVLWWLVWYMQTSTRSNAPLWQHILPAFQEKMHLDILQTKYKAIAPYIKNNDTKILLWSVDQLQGYIDDTPLFDVLKGEYNISVYVDEFGE